MAEPQFHTELSMYCFIPNSVWQGRTLHRMDHPKPAMNADVDADHALAANFAARMGSRSVQTLRQEMADAGIAIGSAAIQAAKLGSRGVRLETLEKFASFFDCTVVDLLRSPPGSEVPWPFRRLDAVAYASIPEEVRSAAEDMLISAAKRSRK